jgi:hypothetical protein
VVVLAFGLTWAVASPLMSVPDEPAHLVKAGAVVRGQFRGPERTTPLGGTPGATRTFVRLPRTFDRLSLLACTAFQPQTTADCAPHLEPTTERKSTPTAVGRYPPVYYLLVGAPSRLADIQVAAYLARALSAAVAATLVALGVAALWVSTRSAWIVVGAALAMTPLVPWLAGSVNSSALEIAAAFAAWGTVLPLLDGRDPLVPAVSDRALLAAAAVSLGLLAWARPSSLVFVAAVVTMAVVAVTTRERLAGLGSDRGARRAMAALALVGAGALAWMVLARPLGSLLGSPIPGLTTMEAARESFSRTGDRLIELVGLFGWRETPLPPPLARAWLGAIGALAAAALVVGRWRDRAALVLLILGVIALPVLSEARVAPRLGFIWQGRYTMPLMLGVPLLSAYVLARSRVRGGAVERIAAFTAVMATGIVHVWVLLFVLSRYEFGLGVGGVLAPLTRTSPWTPPIPAGVLVAAMLLGTVLVALTLLRAGNRRARASGRATPG